MNRWLLALAGVCVVAAFWRYQAIPAPDLVTFLETGRALWHGHLPSQFQRGPVLGLIVYPMSLVMGAVTSCLLLNAVLYVASLVLLERVGRIWIPRASVLVALVCMCNPWVVEMMTRTLAETLLTFLVLLTFWLALVKRSRWAWAAAMLATMTRGDAVGLIPMILLLCPGWWRPGNLMYAVLAALPLAVWTLLGQTSSAFHYAQIIEPSRILDASGWLSCVQTAIWPIPAVWPLAVAFWVLVALSTRWTWSLACFALPYCLIHASYPYQEARMWVPVAWALVIMAGVGWSYVYEHRPKLSVLSLAAVLGLSLLTMAPRVMQYGARDQEFKQLADWAKQNVKPGEKVATTLWEVLNLTTGSDRFIPADAKGATYVCWDSRLGTAVDKDVWKVQQRSMLAEAKNHPGYVYLGTFVNSRDRSRYINIFKKVE